MSVQYSISNPFSRWNGLPVILSAVSSVVSRRAVFAYLVLSMVIFLTRPVVSDEAPMVRDYEVKAGFLVKLTQYTVWPPNTFADGNIPIVIGVLGGDLLFKRLEQEIRGATSPRPVKVRQLDELALEEGAHCQVVFIGRAKKRQEAQWFKALKGKPILTVGESDLTIANGAIMRFVIQNENVRFEVNLKAAAENQLTLSERVLAVASRVYKQTTPE